MNKMKLVGTFCTAVVLVAAVSCGDKKTRSAGWEFSRNMYDPIGYNPDQPNKNFANGITAQLPPDGTTPVGFERFEYPATLEGYEAAGAELVNPLVRTQQSCISRSVHRATDRKGKATDPSQRIAAWSRKRNPGNWKISLLRRHMLPAMVPILPAVG